jgi:hypothetical protein
MIQGIAVTLVFTARAYELNRGGSVTDRYKKAVHHELCPCLIMASTLDSPLLLHGSPRRTEMGGRAHYHSRDPRHLAVVRRMNAAVL